VGPAPGDAKEIRILNRMIRWSEGCIEYEADDKHAKAIVKELGLQDNSKGGRRFAGPV
jgi:hypothetical protein